MNVRSAAWLSAVWMVAIPLAARGGERLGGGGPAARISAEAGLAAMGLLDVTAPPFSADPAGRRDATAALQRAIDYARDHQLVCFFPPGRYLVSDTLECRQFRPLLPSGRRRGTRDFPCVLVGSRRGPQRPRIVLAPRSPGFTDPEKPKYVIHFWAPGMGTEVPIDKPQPNISMNQMLVGIDLEIGEGNAGAVAIRHRAAQGSGVQDCMIDARHGYCGLEGGAGSGGSHANVTVIGGRIGADLRETQPAPTIVGFTLIGQSETALLCGSRQALCAVGLRIEKSSPGPAIVTMKQWGAHHGQLCLVDSQIVMNGGPGATAVAGEASVSMHNVYLAGVDTIARLEGYDPQPALDSPWTLVREFAAGVPQRRVARNYGGRVFAYPAPIYVDGRRRPQPLASLAPAEGPPADLQSRHLWDASFPHWEAAAVNVKAPPYEAAGDGSTDDAAAIQRAVDEHDVVFLPKGTYAVSRTIRLRPRTRLIGVHRCYTWLLPLDKPGGDFHDPARPRPVVQTPDDPRADCVLAWLGVRTLEHSTAASCLDWRSGRRSIFRGVNIVLAFRSPPQGPARRMDPGQWAKLYNHPVVRIRGAGGGRWYNFHQESSRGHGPDYRHLLIEGAAGPLNLYQCNPEHARSDANMEVRGARRVSIYGLKGEYNQPILWIRDSDHVRLFGYGGNAAAAEGGALFLVERTPNFLLANLVDSPRMPQGIPDTYFAGDGVDPRRWSMVIERPRGGGEVRTAPLERPVLYRRGWPETQTDPSRAPR